MGREPQEGPSDTATRHEGEGAKCPRRNQCMEQYQGGKASPGARMSPRAPRVRDPVASMDDQAIFDAPALVLLDFRSAFPSLSRESVSLAALASEMPVGWQRVLDALYRPSTPWIGSGARSEAMQVGAGVPQGCPASGSIFVVATEVVVLMLQGVVALSWVLVFAADLALVIPSMTMAEKVQHVLDTFKTVSNLELELRLDKSIIIPLREAYYHGEDVCERYRRLLETVCPPWATTKIQLAAEYFGILIGPCATPARR